MLKIFAVLAVLVLAHTAFASGLDLDQRTSDFNQLVAQIKSSYGPLQYKNSTQNVDIDILAEEYLLKIAGTRTNGEFYYLINQFVAEFKDSHFATQVPTDYKAVLPVIFEYVDGHVVVESVTRSGSSSVSTTDFPYERGDELVSLNGVPVLTLVDQLSSYIGEGNPLTSKKMGSILLTLRPGKILPVPTGTAVLRMKKRLTGEEAEVKLNWTVSGQPIDEDWESTPRRRGPERPSGYSLEKKEFAFKDLSMTQMWEDILGDRMEYSYMCSGTSRITMPDKATMVMKEPFVAYYYPTAKGNVGYLRIPHYAPKDQNYELAFKQYEYAVSMLEKNTVGLVIDQDHNCGGNVDYLEHLLGLFMDKNYSPVQFQLVANKQNYLEYKNYLAQLNPFTIEYQEVTGVADMIKNAWLKGEFMTDKTSIDGKVLMNPDSVHYTKPIIVLIDEMSGSGGDAFPAMMGGTGRAVLLGTRTMGAGGHVTQMPALNYSQMSVRMTRSLFFRPDGIPVENHGAEPSIPYTISLDDFLNGYKGYREFYTQKLLDLIQ